MFVNICGPVVGSTAYRKNKLIGRDVTITLPEVAPTTADLKAMGTFSMPIWQIIEHMEASINKIGVDEGLCAAITPEMEQLEFRWVQTVTDANGKTKNVGCKAFIKGIPGKIPGVGIEVGSASESEIPIAVSRYQLIVDGKEMWLIDRFASIVRINGKNYADIGSML